MRARLADRPIRVRIAGWIGLISIVLLTAMALAVYGVFAQQLMADLDQTIALRSASYEQLIDWTAQPPVLTVAKPDVELATGEGVLRLYETDGTPVQDLSPISVASTEERALVERAVATGHPQVRTIDLSDKEDYRILARPVDNGTRQLILVSGLELSRINGPLRLLRAILAIAAPLTALAASAGGYLVVMRGLEPVSAMAETARQIAAGDLSQRVPGADSRDELGQFATTLNVMIDRIDETLQRERRFASDASHELRTPLAAVDATVDVTLAYPRTEDDYRAALRQIREQTARLTYLTSQLLLLSRLDAGTFGQAFELVDLDEVVSAIAQPFAEGSSSLTILIEQDSGRHIVLGDFELLARAFLNIVENAVSHAGDQITLIIWLRAQPGASVITFTDNGAGIPDELAETMFERFRRGNAARSTTGSGLGLSIVRAIVEAHGGRVMMDRPDDGIGTRVTILLPMAAPGTG